MQFYSEAVGYLTLQLVSVSLISCVLVSRNSGTHSSFEICRPTLIEPEVLPRCITDQVTAPAVGELVCDNVDICSIL